MASNTPPAGMPTLPGYTYDVTTNRYFRVPRPGDEPLPILSLNPQPVPRAIPTPSRSRNNFGAQPSHPLRLSRFLRDIETQSRTSTHAEHVAASILALPFIHKRSCIQRPSHTFGRVWSSIRGHHCSNGSLQGVVAETEFLPSISDRMLGGVHCIYRQGHVLIWDSTPNITRQIHAPALGCLSLACCGNFREGNTRNWVRLAVSPGAGRDSFCLYISDQRENFDRLDVQRPDRRRNRGPRQVNTLTTVRWTAPPAANADERYSSSALPVAGSRSGYVYMWDTRASRFPISFASGAFGFGGMVCCIRGRQNVLYVSRCSTNSPKDIPELAAWDIRMPTKSPLMPFHGHVNEYRNFHFDVWNGVLAAGSDDENVRLWDAARGGEPVAELLQHDLPINVVLGDLNADGCYVGGLRVDYRTGHGFYSPSQPRPPL